MRVLVTGITGFVGSHFAEYALARGVEVVGSYRWRSKTENIDHLQNRIELVECDLRDTSSAHHLVEVARPDWVIHLAAQSFVGASWQAPAETFVTNAVSQVNLLEALRGRTPHPRFLVIGSSEEYGFVQEDELPITEGNPLRPLSPYAVSKVAQDLMGYQYWKSYGMHIVRARAFNHEGPRRGDVFVTSNFARQIAEIELGLREPVIAVGNLTTRRDYTDVRDIVRGYWMLLEQGEPGEVYNLCSGRDWVIADILAFLLGEARVPGITTREDRSRLRPSDVPVLRGDAGKAAKAVGWQPEIPFEQTLRDILEHWRGRVGRRS
jgi:GDP-4-dehydro-6-deoxy-D-mannose reductase